MMRLIEVALIGIGATACIDLWAVLLRSALGVRSLDYCMLGRWALHMRHGAFAHDNIAAAAKQTHECGVGWTAHYSIGVLFAICFAWLMPDGWLQHPTVLPALLFGMATVVVPFFTLQPAFGLGVAAARTPNPTAARLKSLMTHTVYGAGLYLFARVVSTLLR